MDVVITARLPRHLTQIGPLCLNSTAPSARLQLQLILRRLLVPGPRLFHRYCGTTTYTFTPELVSVPLQLLWIW